MVHGVRNDRSAAHRAPQTHQWRDADDPTASLFFEHHETSRRRRHGFHDPNLTPAQETIHVHRRSRSGMRRRAGRGCEICRFHTWLLCVTCLAQCQAEIGSRRLDCLATQLSVSHHYVTRRGPSCEIASSLIASLRETAVDTVRGWYRSCNGAAANGASPSDDRPTPVAQP